VETLLKSEKVHVNKTFCSAVFITGTMGKKAEKRRDATAKENEVQKAA
jgi:hypothetical protein